MSKNIDIEDLGLVNYIKAWDLQKELLEKRKNNEINDKLILLEHPHTYTLGRTAQKSHIICPKEFLEANKISVYEIDRGGDITYHGPGQIVGYPIIKLEDNFKDSHKYLRLLEEVIILTLNDYGISAVRKEGFTGVWVGERKICAIGVKISSWITMHGFALNVNTDLSLFRGIIPCGISDKEVTSLEKELGEICDIQKVKDVIIKYFKEKFEYA